MYDKLLKELERAIVVGKHNVEGKALTEILDLIIKIKTIQAMDVSADLIRVSREVGKN